MAIKVIDLTGSSHRLLDLGATDDGSGIINLMVSPSYPGLDIGRGLVTGQSYQAVQATNPEVGTTFEDLWDARNILIYPGAGETWELVSTSANDTAAGSGAREVRIDLLDDLYGEQVLNIVPNGTTPVVFPVSDAFRFRQGKVIDGGGTFDKKNAGDITIRVSGGGDERGKILAGDNKTFNGQYTVPAGKTAFLIAAACNLNKNKDAEVKLLATTGDDGIFLPSLPLSIYQDTLPLADIIPATPIIEKSDTKFMAQASNSGTRVALTCVFLLVDN